MPPSVSPMQPIFNPSQDFTSYAMRFHNYDRSAEKKLARH